MDTPEKISEVVSALQSGHRVEPVTVRSFLEFFGAARRGSSKSEAIREVLEREGLETVPDFQGGWIDKEINFRLAGGDHDGEKSSDVSSLAQGSTPNIDVVVNICEASDSFSADDPSSATSTTEQVSSLAGAISIDPTFRISSLPAANKVPDSLKLDDTIECAVTRMLQNDFSQMPVVHGARDIRGIVSWKGIATNLLFRPHVNYVHQIREEVHIVDENRTLFDVIPIVAQHGYVMVRFVDKTVRGPVTSSDLELHLQTLTQPFLLLREIELHVRRLLGNKISSEDFGRLASAGTPSADMKMISDLTFGQYVRLLQNPDTWKKVGIRIDRSIFVAMLDKVRVIRNDVMHFDPDPMTDAELGELQKAVRFMQSLQALMHSD